MIRADKLTKKYVGRAAVDEISFEVGTGEIVGFLGPNGAGKTSTLRMLTGYMPPTSGTALVGGHDVFHQSIKARSKIGYMPEDVPLYNEMRVKEYIHFVGRLHGLGGKSLRSQAGLAMEQCRVTDVRKKMISSLSKGYRQRVGMAAALIHDPPLLILDEPTNGLDPNQIRQVRSMIRDLGEERTILLSTHILSEVEAICERVIILNEGKIRAQGTPQDLIAKLRTAGALRIEVKATAAEVRTELGKVNGVRKVRLADPDGSAEPDPDGWIALQIIADSKEDIRSQVHAAIAAAGWPLREFVLHRASLEDAFVELTHTDNAAA